MRRGVRVAAIVALVMGACFPAASAMGSVYAGETTAMLGSSLEIEGLDAVESARVRALWAEFVSGVSAHRTCLLSTPPRVVARADMPPRAAYAPDAATLYVKPGDLPRLVVFHELAHHLDFTCGAADDIGTELRRAQGLADSKGWWLDGAPITWPAEYFANAVAIALGEESRHAVAPATVELVSAWGGIGAGEAVPDARRTAERDEAAGVLLLDEASLLSPLV